MVEGRAFNVHNAANVPSARRKVFFTDYGQIPKVERCDMDGQNRTKLVDSKIVFPHGITLDLVSRLVYWADAYLDYIEVVDYEGKGRQTIIQGILVRGKLLQGSHSLGLPVRGRTVWDSLSGGKQGGHGEDVASTLVETVILDTPFTSLFSLDPYNDPWEVGGPVS